MLIMMTAWSLSMTTRSVMLLSPSGNLRATLPCYFSYIPLLLGRYKPILHRQLYQLVHHLQVGRRLRR
jgi:hypothetical protein